MKSSAIWRLLVGSTAVRSVVTVRVVPAVFAYSLVLPSIATVYRTVRLFEEANILNRHDFGDGRARYEETPDEHHDHLIDVESGRVIEFHNEEIEALQERIAANLGFKLVGHRLELYGVPLDRAKKR